MDDYTRGKEKLDLKVDQLYDFVFEEAGSIGRLRWAWNATEMGYQIASRIAIVSFVLGVIGLLLGTASLVDWHRLYLLWDRLW